MAWEARLEAALQVTAVHIRSRQFSPLKPAPGRDSLRLAAAPRRIQVLGEDRRRDVIAETVIVWPQSTVRNLAKHNCAVRQTIRQVSPRIR